jgi:hypothetical protein
MIADILIVLTIWIIGGGWYFLDHLGDKNKAVSKLKHALEAILLAPLFLVLIPVGLYRKYKDWKNSSKITSV